MKQIVVISGKGGVGKTVLTGALAAIAKSQVIADCDVDAADLHLLLNPKIAEEHIFTSGVTAEIDRGKCIRCGKCTDLCRFDAISADLIVNPINCEGCNLCYNVCPVGAIILKANVAGTWFLSATKFGPFVHAKLGIAEENSGKLVAVVKQQAQRIAQQQNKDFIIVDGPPGIGCPVIASLAGADYAVVITEPTLSGLHDVDRVIKVARHFQIPVKLVINKFDLNLAITATIEQYGIEYKIPIIGKIKFNKEIINSVVASKTILEIADSDLKNSIKEIWQNIIN